MISETKNLTIKTRTSGFASPAESYVEKRLDLNDLIIENVYTTFYFRYSGPSVFNVNQGDVLVIDKSLVLEKGDLVILTEKDHFKLREYDGQINVWGKVSWVLNKKK
jgi:SOS-response transcriptional repressor LexA